MKEETNNEMDLLLRRLGRRPDGSASAAGDHLDADELSAYSENVLPAAARARYTAHLAECSRCRELVVQLSSAAGVVTAPESVQVPGTSFLKKLLASLFSPMVLRYAAPALGLIVVAVIGLIVLRRDRISDHVAKLQETPATNNGPAAATSPVDRNSGFYDQQQKTSTQNGRANMEAGRNQSVPPPPNAPPTVSSITVTPSPGASPQKVEQQAANEPSSQAAPKPAVTTDEKQQAKDTEARKKEAEQAPATPQPAEESVGVEKRDDRQVADMAAAGARPAAKRAPATARGVSSVAKLSEVEKKEKDDSAETRSVAGRRFRKDGGIWIDTAYDSSRSTTNLTRGSEQYRALIADEPAIKTIADQLDGEFIVVWKGHAYRIR